MNKALTVYKASAGSGKTFTLATEYIKLLIDNPMSYRNILAVTFTNKATEEMKTRILGQLYGIWQGLPDSDSYLDAIRKTMTDIQPEEIKRRAGTALNLLLHHYSYFRVETIDSFFQSVLRNMARELDLTANLRIELNDGQVEELAVDKLIEQLKVEDDLMKWILNYIQDNIDDDKSWNVIAPLKAFGKTIFRDYYKAESKQLNEVTSDSNFFRKYIESIREDAIKAKKAFTDMGNDYFKALNDNGLTVDDIAGKSRGISSFFMKMRDLKSLDKLINKTAMDAALDSEKWVSKTHLDPARVTSVAESTLMPMLKKAINEAPQLYRRIVSAQATLRHLNELRLLESIERKVRQLNEDACQFLLSDTQQLLHSLINDNDSPFIFEKIGSMLQHIMIDEFQDTSTVQWQNFKVLLQECMSHKDAHNIIVGDVKQSIYRWRSGDWRLLNNITGEFDNSDRMVDVTTLDTNYRSQGNIIHFNNKFFTKAAEIECDAIKTYLPEMAQQLKKAYADVTQKIPKFREMKGEVVVEMLPNGKDEDNNYIENTLMEVEGIVTDLIDNGATQESIAILVRTNKHIPLIADHFARNCPEVEIVSDEAFLMVNALALNIITQALHFITHPDEQLALAILVKMYLSIDKPEITDNDILMDKTALKRLLPAEYTENIDTMATLPLFELVENIYALFHLERLDNEAAYLCAFYDELTRFVSNKSGNIDDFVEEWDTNIRRKTICGMGKTGVRILSIHKSKGLEFDNVIIPFCDWRNEMAGSLLWCRPEAEPYDKLPLVAVDYKKELADSIYSRHYFAEKSQNTVDNLNLLYVAFTRAGNNLYVISQRGASDALRAQLVESTMTALAHEMPEMTQTGMEDEMSPLVFSYGERYISKKKSKKATDNVILKESTPIDVEMADYNAKVEYRQSNKSRQFIEGEDEENNGYLTLGSILHNVFSTIRNIDDIDSVLMQLEQDGVIYDELFNRQRILNMLRKRLTHPKVAEWFSGKCQLYNECTILSMDKDTGNVIERRPDRVMYDGEQMTVVDFKFGKPHDDYHDQVREYMQLLRSMGYSKVKGYLWFVYSNNIEEVI